jgi:hypothetical protein
MTRQQGISYSTTSSDWDKFHSALQLFYVMYQILRLRSGRSLEEVKFGEFLLPFGAESLIHPQLKNLKD